MREENVDISKLCEEDDLEPCFPGDMGRLTRDARLVLTALIKRSYIDAEYNKTLWKALVKYKDEVAAALNDLFLELDIREDIGIAAAVQADDVNFTISSKLKAAKPLTAVQAQVLLYLLELYWSKRFDGAESVFFPLDEVERELSGVVRQGEDKVKAATAIKRVVNNLCERGLVREVSSSSSGSSIWQVLRSVEFFDRNQARAAAATYRQDLEGEGERA